jgi:hypothetical protein
MPCGPKCACHGTGIECLSVVDPVNFGYLSEWCDSGDDLKRRIVLGRSRIAAETGHVATSAPVPVVPSLLRKAANFGKAIVDHVAAGMPTASDATVRERLATCQECDRFGAENRECLVCGCQLDIKVRWAEQRCPIGKW